MIAVVELARVAMVRFRFNCPIGKFRRIPLHRDRSRGIVETVDFDAELLQHRRE